MKIARGNSLGTNTFELHHRSGYIVDPHIAISSYAKDIMYRNFDSASPLTTGPYNRNNNIENGKGMYIFIREAPAASDADTQQCITPKAALTFNFHGELIDRPVGTYYYPEQNTPDSKSHVASLGARYPDVTEAKYILNLQGGFWTTD